MTRREILRYSAGLTGAALSVPFISAFLSGCTIKKEDLYQSKFFSDEDFEFLRSFMDFLLPKTDSPSATEVGVDQMLDHMNANVFNRGQQQQTMKTITLVRDYFASKDMGEAFQACEDLSEDDEIKAAYSNLKGQAIAYYLTSEKIGEEFLNYLPVPGLYQPCISVEEVGNKKWAE